MGEVGTTHPVLSAILIGVSLEISSEENTPRLKKFENTIPGQMSRMRPRAVRSPIPPWRQDPNSDLLNSQLGAPSISPKASESLHWGTALSQMPLGEVGLLPPGVDWLTGKPGSAGEGGWLRCRMYL